MSKTTFDKLKNGEQFEFVKKSDVRWGFYNGICTRLTGAFAYTTRGEKIEVTDTKLKVLRVGKSAPASVMPEQPAGFTPGPWAVHNNIGKKSELGIVADAAPCVIVTMHGTKEWPAITRANARLIAAAPDLLAAVEDMKKYLEAMLPAADSIMEKQNWEAAYKLLKNNIAKARAL